MAIMQCPDCGGKVSTKATSCPHCGAPVTGETPSLKCNECGTSMPANAKTCPACGAPAAALGAAESLAASTTAPEAPSPAPAPRPRAPSFNLPESIAPSASQAVAPVGAIVAGYVGLLVCPLVSMGVAIYMLTKKHVGHGVAMLVLSIPMFFVWIGIVAAIAIPKFANTKEKAYVASMKSDLRNLITAQEAYFADNVTYSHTIVGMNYSVSAGNQIVIIEASGTGWSGTAASSGTSSTCGIYVGAVTPPVAGEPEGAPTCQ